MQEKARHDDKLFERVQHRHQDRENIRPSHRIGLCVLFCLGTLLYKKTKSHTLVLTCVRTQILYLISAFHVFPKPGFAVMDAVLPYVSVRPLPTFSTQSVPVSVFPADLCFLLMFVTIAGSVSDSRHHLCRLTKIPDVRDNETSTIRGGAGLAYTAVDTVQHATGPTPYRFGHDGVSQPARCARCQR